MNQDGRTLAAELAKAARARREAGTAGKATTPGTGAKPDQETQTAEASAAAKAPGSDDTNAALTPETDVEAQPAETGEASTADADAETEPTKPEEPKAVREMRKRIDKLTAKIKALEAEKARVAEPPPMPLDDAPEVHPELAELDSKIATYETHLAWFDQNPEGGAYKDERGNEIAHVAPERVANLRRQTERALAELQGKRAARVERIETERRAERQRIDAEVVQQFPWLANPEAPEFVEAQGLLSVLPRRTVASLESLPNARQLLAWAVTGKLAMASKAQRPTPAPSTRPVPPKVLAPAATSAPRQGPSDSIRREYNEAKAAFEKSGREKDQKRMLQLERALKRAA